MAKSTIRHKHIPERTCIACRRKKPKRELIRIVRTPQNSVIMDTRGKESGRGAYICRSRDCWTDSLKRKRVSYALKVDLTSDQLSELFKAAEELFNSSKENE